MEKLVFRTSKKEEIIDITQTVNELLEKKEKDYKLCHLFLLHTTAALSVADLDPGTDLDILEALRKMIPNLKYRHPHNPLHVGDHILSTLIGPSLVLPVLRKNLVLGTWQRVILLEFDGPKERVIHLTLI
jgi:secondary thiamine-phosphate synthase enzyme